jgi:hypothetical protein
MACKPMTEPADPDWQPTECDSLDPSNCLFPFPNQHFLSSDSETETGYRVAFGEAALPLNIDGVQVSPKYWNEKDGFSVNSHPMAWFDELSTTGLTHWSDAAPATGDLATTAIVDTVTGELVPHFAELDMSVERAHASLVLQPLAPLLHDRRYVVGLKGLVKDDGSPVDVSDAFMALRDGDATTDPDVEYRRDRYDTDVFPALNAVGFPQQDLQLAWDFHTMSVDSSIGRMLWLKDDAHSRWGDAGPAYTIDSIDNNTCTGSVRIARTIYGTVTIPLYSEVDAPGNVLNRDANNQPFANGDKQARFMIRVPCSVALASQPSPILHWGHGLLGTYEEGRSSYLSTLINDGGWVMLSMPSTGMTDDDRDEIVWMAADDVSNFAFVPERTMQGFVESMGGLAALQGDLGQDPALQFPNENGDLVSVIDPETAYYYGNSQGAVLGGAYLALSPSIERGVLGVGGSPFSLLLSRSIDFTAFYLVFDAKFDDGRDVTLMLSNVMQMLWDEGESGGYHTGYATPFAGNPEKQALMHTAIGDLQVSTLGGRNQARALGAGHIAPHDTVIGLDEVATPFAGSAYQEWFYPDAAVIHDESIPPVGADPHECVRREARTQQQIITFLNTGEAINACDGPCEGLVADTCNF